MQLPRNFTRGFRPPAFFCQTDPVFAGDDAAPCEDLREKFIESALNFLANAASRLYRSAMMLTWMLPSPAWPKQAIGKP